MKVYCTMLLGTTVVLLLLALPALSASTCVARGSTTQQHGPIFDPAERGPVPQQGPQLDPDAWPSAPQYGPWADPAG